MNYHPDDILRLIDAVEADGGAALPDPCKPRKFRLAQPTQTGGTKMTDQYTTGCGKETRFVVVYDPAEEVQLPSTSGLSNTVKADEDPVKRARKIHRRATHASPEVTEEEVTAQIERGARFATVCAVDDNMGMWPRFTHLMEES